ncbi:ABC transporter permease [Granulibacter bethesdensis]|uniref:ABC transporter permease protein n=1 Tax=Granulibacter bethesdensis TaxID=364410 RepID=A0AAN0RBU2_9PROT|nr:ABC transporter permease subunit [Granulibacter bethesdensis]AHJ61904.1 ABC transporter permease protein [Granulibacter bethesdensis]AHJ67143.1 ABC transporter permease protein [Granulibacter bethesdensis]APH50827.1 ABC transporter permease protein [Granulibacter bethesdensis]
MSETVFPALASRRRLPNLFDLVSIAVVFAALVAVVHVTRGTLVPLDDRYAHAVSLDPWNLPAYAFRTTLRMLLALAAALFFTFTYATWAAKSRRAAMLLIPMLDILQSVPILGFLTFTVVFFMNLFPGQVLGAELASIFAIFTSQAWNMAFSFYQSLTTLPGDLVEATRAFRLSPWQRFWKLEVPFAMPGLVWNAMMSMSGGWFFVVASEAVSVGDNTWMLPGIGSYVALALRQQDMAAIGYAILAMAVVILLYDQLLFRPLVAWSEKFRFETTQGSTSEEPWLLRLLRRTAWLRAGSELLASGFNAFTNLRIGFRLPRLIRASNQPSRIVDMLWGLIVFAMLVWCAWHIYAFLSGRIAPSDVLQAVLMGCITMLRVIVLMIVATLIWVPIGVAIGLRPHVARFIQPLVQFLAAFPANLFFPLFVLVIARFSLNPDIWLTPLMILGAQWYIMFNVIAGAAAFPGDMQEAARGFHIRGFLWWRRVILPGIFPYYITGAITASGGAWNAAIVSEVVTWGPNTLQAHGLGRFIADASADGNWPRTILGVAVMSAFVVGFNRALWKPLFNFATRRLTY